MNDTAPNVIVIPAKVETPQEQEKKRHLRVAAYCRVSTDSEEQLSSYENQLSYYTEKIMKEPGWTMAGATRKWQSRRSLKRKNRQVWIINGSVL